MIMDQTKIILSLRVWWQNIKKYFFPFKTTLKYFYFASFWQITKKNPLSFWYS